MLADLLFLIKEIHFVPGTVFFCRRFCCRWVIMHKLALITCDFFFSLFNFSALLCLSYIFFRCQETFPRSYVFIFFVYFKHFQSLLFSNSFNNCNKNFDFCLYFIYTLLYLFHIYFFFHVITMGEMMEKKFSFSLKISLC